MNKHSSLFAASGLMFLMLISAIIAYWGYEGQETFSEASYQNRNDVLESAQGSNYNVLQETEDRLLATNSQSNDQSTFGANYQLFQSDTFKKQASARRLLFFYSDDCPVCRFTNHELSKKQTAWPADLFVYRVYYKDEKATKQMMELAERYQVSQNNTFVVVDSKGQVLETWVGGGLDRILEKISDL